MTAQVFSNILCFPNVNLPPYIMTVAAQILFLAEIVLGLLTTEYRPSPLRFFVENLLQFHTVQVDILDSQQT